ncbi:MAG: amidohydrolase family protein [Bryobacteraceae bacterium]
MRTLRISLSLVASLSLFSQRPQALDPVVKKYVAVEASRIVLEHVRVIDGTGRPPLEDRNIVIENGKIADVQPGADVRSQSGQIALSLSGDTVLPGLVGMHNHLYYIARPDLDGTGHSEPPLLVPQMTFSSPRLYLAAGVTTMRTTGSVETYADLNLKRFIDSGSLPGPHIDVTAPYLEGSGSFFIQMHALTGPEDARRFVNYWADQGATSFKAYMNITREELRAAIEEAHKRGLKVTGHLCSVTYTEAAELGIDNLEHGFFVNTGLDPGKQPDVCPSTQGQPTLERMDPNGPEAQRLFRTLVAHHVAITSTLPVFEHLVPGRPSLEQRVLDVMTPEARDAYLYSRNRRATSADHDAARWFRRDMELERAFVKAGGLLLTGPDPTGNGGTVPGFGDQRGVALLVEAGFTPVEAIQIATMNGATYLGRQDRIGSVAPGKNADLDVVVGNPAAHIEDIQNIKFVFKDGLGFDPAKLIDSVRGRYGQY